MELKDRIKHAREAKGLTQVDATKMVGIARQTYMNYENGKNEPPLATLIKMTEVFHVDFTWLAIGEHSNPNYKAINAIAMDLAKVHTHLIEFMGGLDKG